MCRREWIITGVSTRAVGPDKRGVGVRIGEMIIVNDESEGDLHHPRDTRSITRIITTTTVEVKEDELIKIIINSRIFAHLFPQLKRLGYVFTDIRETINFLQIRDHV